ncbi:MAG: FliM/FliN family flagellar motor switch protein [Pseudomonadota bacterium]
MSEELQPQYPDPHEGQGEPNDLEQRDHTDGGRHRRAIFGMPVQIVVSVGKAEPTVGELLGMGRDSIIPLDTRVDDPVEIMVGKRVIARGELQEIEDANGGLGVRLTEIVDIAGPF